MFLRTISSLFFGGLLCLSFNGYAQPQPVPQAAPAAHNSPKQTLKSKVDPHLLEAVKKSVDKGIHFLRTQQAKDGSYGHHVGLTAMTLLALAESHRGYNEGDGPYMSRAVEWLVAQAREDGSISGDATPTYNTALAIMALHALSPTKYKALIERGQRFLTRFQSDEDQNYTPKDKYYGGIGYGGDERPDLSNLHYALEALKKTDYDPNSDVWKKAEIFVKRCQNFTEEDEKDVLARPWAGNDGGFIYEPGSSRAGGTTSYGAMTFAGLKSLIFTNRANRNDSRVKAALNWIQNHYDFNSHPGMGTTAYYYYLQTAASALEAYGTLVLKGKEGKQYHWTSDLLTKVINLQQENGSWINENRKYWEGNPILVTARSIITVNHIFRTLGSTQPK